MSPDPQVIPLAGLQVLAAPPDGPRLGGERDATDLIGAALSVGADLVALPVQRLPVDFFPLSTRLAGEILQKFTNYGVRLAIVGDLSEEIGRSRALQDFVRESNRGAQVWFVPDMAGLERRLLAR